MPAQESLSATAISGAGSSRVRRTTGSRQQNGARSRSSKRHAHIDDDDYVPAARIEPVPAISPRPSRSDDSKGKASRDTSEQGAMLFESLLLNEEPSADTIQGGISQSMLEPSDPALASSSTFARPRRVRQPTRRKLSPISLIDDNANPRNGGDNGLLETGKDESEEPETPLSKSKLKSSGHPGRRRSNVHKDSDLHPSQIRSISPPPSASKVTAASTTTPGPSTTKPTESTPTLKIRLPRLGSINLPSISAPPPTTPTTNSHSMSAARGRPQRAARSAGRRSSRGQASTSASLKEASVSSEA